jgi:hypothetical protein
MIVTGTRRKARASGDIVEFDMYSLLVEGRKLRQATAVLYGRRVCRGGATNG